MQYKLLAVFLLALISFNAVVEAQSVCELLCGNGVWDCSESGDVDAEMADRFIVPLVLAALEVPLLAQYFIGDRGGRVNYADEANSEDLTTLVGHLVGFFVDETFGFNCSTVGTEFEPLDVSYLPTLGAAHTGLGVREIEQGLFLGATLGFLFNEDNIGAYQSQELNDAITAALVGQFSDPDVNGLFVQRTSIGDILADEAFQVTGTEEDPIFPGADEDSEYPFEVNFWVEVVVSAFGCLLESDASDWFDGTLGLTDYTDPENAEALTTLALHLATFTTAATETSIYNLPAYGGNPDMQAVHNGQNVTDEAFDAFLDCLGFGVGSVYAAAGGSLENVAEEGGMLFAVLESLRVQIVDNGSGVPVPVPEPTPEPEEPSPEEPSPEEPSPEEPEEPTPEGPEPSEEPPSSGSIVIASLTIVLAMVSIFMF